MSMTHNEMIAVIQADRDGKEVEWRPTGAERWRLATPLWDFDTCEYRIKPEPKAIWVNEYEDGSLRGHNTEQCADRYCRNAVGDVGDDVVRAAVKYQEVTE